MTRAPAAGPMADLGHGTIRSRSLAHGRRLGLASALAAAAAALGVVASSWLLVAGAVVTSLVCGILALRGSTWGPPQRGSVRCRDGGLTLDDRRIAAGDRIEYVLPVDPGAVLVGAAGREHQVIVGARTRQELLDALRATDDAVTVRWRRHLRPLLGALGLIAVGLFGAGAFTGTLLDVPVLGGLVATLLVIFAVWLAPRTDSITIGTDGVAIRKAVERVVPLSGIERVSVVAPAGRTTGPRALELTLHDGSRVRIEVGDGDPLLVDAIRAEVERRRAVIVRGGSGRGVLERLVRDGRSPAEWASALGALLGGGGGFRDTAVSEDDVLAVLEDASAPAEARVGAAIALASQSEEHADIVREVAADVASPRLRVALDEAVRGQTSDELVDAAVAEEENAVGRAR